MIVNLLALASLIGLVFLGVYEIQIWWVVPFACLNSFIGMHFPPEKAHIAIEKGVYTKILVTSFPLQAVFACVLYGIGRLIGWMT